MKKLRKTLSVMLSAAVVLSTTACSQGDSKGSNGNLNDITTDSNGEMSFTEAPVVEIDDETPTGKIVYLSYETGFDESNDMVALFKKRYGGDFEHEMCSSGNAYFEKLGTMISTGLSPDLVRYEWRSFPHGMSYNMYTPLDTYIDIDSDLWKDMKDIAEQFVYNGKHYYYPHQLKTNYALNYNNRVLEENGMTDPYALFQENKWTWSAFEEMLKQWCDMDPNHIGYNGVGGMIFVLTTGTKIVDIQGNEIINNLKTENVSRTMLWLEDMRRQGLLGASLDQQAMGYSSGYVAPDQAFIDGNLLFLGMDPSWTYPAAKEALDTKGLENELKFLPFPRDELADTYYCGIDTFGYLIPSGAPNVKGAVDWINMHRTEEIDEENIAKAKADAISDAISYYPKCANKDCGDTSDSHDDQGRHIFTDEENESGMSTCPSCGTERREKYKVVWSEEQWDLYQEMKSTDGRFTMLFDHCYGFSDDVSGLFNGDESLMDSPVFHDLSFTSLVESKNGVLEGYLNQYRDIMKKNAEGELVTYPVDDSAAA
ncbi:MAG: carbohydrate ABC transporter substrate-binding protein [Ruminococcaceae bacterium]|nr:carbohydrate ABC transporter substrate-binding protein [Oscillospiraceae bacterium]